MVVSATWAWSTQMLHNRDARKGCFWWLPRADTRAPISAFTPHTSIKDSLIVNSTMYNQPILMPSEIFKVLRLKSQLITQLESFVSSWWSHFPEITSSFSAVLSTHFDPGNLLFLWASVDSQIGQIEMGIITVFAQAAQNLPLLSQESWPRHAKLSSPARQLNIVKSKTSGGKTLQRNHTLLQSVNYFVLQASETAISASLPNIVHSLSHVRNLHFCLH